MIVFPMHSDSDNTYLSGWRKNNQMTFLNPLFILHKRPCQTFVLVCSADVFLNNFKCVLKILPFFKYSYLSAVGPPNLGRAQAPYSVLSFCLLGKKYKFTRKIELNYIHHEDEHWNIDDHSIVFSSEYNFFLIGNLGSLNVTPS